MRRCQKIEKNNVEKLEILSQHLFFKNFLNMFSIMVIYQVPNLFIIYLFILFIYLLIKRSLCKVTNGPKIRVKVSLRGRTRTPSSGEVWTDCLD